MMFSVFLWARQSNVMNGESGVQSIISLESRPPLERCGHAHSHHSLAVQRAKPIPHSSHSYFVMSLKSIICNICYFRIYDTILGYTIIKNTDRSPKYGKQFQPHIFYQQVLMLHALSLQFTTHIKSDSPKNKFVTMIMSNTKIIPSSIWRASHPHQARMETCKFGEAHGEVVGEQQQAAGAKDYRLLSIGDQTSTAQCFEKVEGEGWLPWLIIPLVITLANVLASCGFLIPSVVTLATGRKDFYIISNIFISRHATPSKTCQKHNFSKGEIALIPDKIQQLCT